jgi:hypothetical protein
VISVTGFVLSMSLILALEARFMADYVADKSVGFFRKIFTSAAIFGITIEAFYTLVSPFTEGLK